jgi:hypothetical protein
MAQRKEFFPFIEKQYGMDSCKMLPEVLNGGPFCDMGNSAEAYHSSPEGQ